jgi:hypothetical protein
MSISSISSFMLLRKSSNAHQARLNRSSAEVDVAGTPRYCLAIMLNVGKLLVDLLPRTTRVGLYSLELQAAPGSIASRT